MKHYRIISVTIRNSKKRTWDEKDEGGGKYEILWASHNAKYKEIIDPSRDLSHDGHSWTPYPQRRRNEEWVV